MRIFFSKTTKDTLIDLFVGQLYDETGTLLTKWTKNKNIFEQNGNVRTDTRDINIISGFTNIAGVL